MTATSAEVKRPQTLNLDDRVLNGGLDLKLKPVLGDDDGLRPIYNAKASLLNDAIQDIGMGRYQW